MQKFLLLTVIGMLAAGIYGTVDLTLDVKNGTLIEYEDEGEETASASQFAYRAKGIFKRTNVKVAAKKEIKKPTPTLVNSFSDLSFEDFSRGEPPMYLEAMLLEKMGNPDSLESTEVETAIKDTVAALKEKAKEVATNNSASLAKKEDRKFSLNLYSRGRPPRPVSKGTVALVSDTTKHE